MSRIVSYFLVSSAALILYAKARCDNQCSGHGSCMIDDVCQCYDNFGSGLSHDSGDCSDRICPYEIAWVDNPDKTGAHHKYMECAGKGICDRASGDCQCFEGFEGKACARAACPNDCSGHGTCEYIEDLSYGATWNDWIDQASPNAAMKSRTVSLFKDQAKTFAYRLWDKTKSRKCVCDATYGDADCSKKLCPFGTDVLDTKDDTWWGIDEQKYQEQTILLSTLSNDFSDIDGKTFALTFKSKLNETFTTIPLRASMDSSNIPDFENDIKNALLKLPNGVIDGVTVKVTYASTMDAASITHINPTVSAKVTGKTSATATASGSITFDTQTVTGWIASGQYIVGNGIKIGTVTVSSVAVISATVTTIVGTIAQGVTLPTSTDISTTAFYSYDFIAPISYDMGIYRGGSISGSQRGIYTDYSQQTPSGEDTAALASSQGFGGNNPNMRSTSTLVNVTGLVVIKVRFTGSSVQGPQHLLTVEDYLCEEGCTPKLTGLPLETRLTKQIWSTVVEITKSDYNSYECGRRGKCDYTSGLCACFGGYAGEYCNILTTLV